MNPILSILIPTVIGRERQFEALYHKLNGMLDVAPYRSAVEILYLRDNKESTIGEKREELYKMANGTFSWQIDDDDDIPYHAIWYVLTNTKISHDCITFQEKCLINGRYYSSNHSLKYEDWGEQQDGFDYVRTPFFKSVIKTEIARSVPIPHIRYGEDHEWARALRPHLKNEIHIDKELYIYQHNSKPEDFQTRYGFDKQ